MRGKDEAQRVALAAVALSVTYFLLFLGRAADDNALTSWSWVFAGRGAVRGLWAANAGLAAAALLARFPWPRRRGGALLALAALAASAAFRREPEVIVDAARYFTQAQHLERFGAGDFLREWGRGVFAWTDLPLVPFLYGAAFRVLGEDRAAVQVLTSALFAGTVALTHRLGTRFWGEEAGFAAGLLLLGIPYLWTQVPLMLTDVPAMFFFTLAVFAFLRALERGGAWGLVLAPAAVFLALLSKYSLWPLLSTLPVAALACAASPGFPGPRACAARGATVALAALALTAAAAAPKLDLLLSQVDLLRTYQWEGLKRWGESPLSTFLFQTSPVLPAAAAASLPVAWRRRDRRLVPVAWPVLLLLVLGSGRSRYWMPALPFLALLAARGILEIGGPALRRFGPLAAALPSLAIALCAYLPFLEGTSAANLQRAGAYLDRLGVRRVEVVTLPVPDAPVDPAVAVPLLDLFTDARVVRRPASGPRPAPEARARSSLRFTWEMGGRGGDGDAAAASDAVVVISGAPPAPAALPADLRGRVPEAVFDAAGDPFRYKTRVAVYVSAR